MRTRSWFVVAAALGALAGSARAQDAPAGEDPVTPLRQAAESVQGEARGAAYAKLATALEGLGRWAEAAEAWRTSYAAGKSPEALAGAGRALLAFAEEVLAAGEPGSAVRGAFADAQAALQQARDLGVKDVAVRIGLARCLAADGRTEEQIAELRSAATEAPDDPAPRRALAFALYHAGRPADAVPVFRALSDAAPDDLALSLTLAACARQAADEPLALEMADRALAHHPRDRRSWEAVWSVYSAGRRWGELAARLATIAAKDETNPLGSHYAGFAFASAQDWDQALRFLDRAWDLDRRNFAARLESARILLQQKKDRDAASSRAREVLAADPQDRRAADLLSFVAQRRSEDGDHAGAVRELEVLTAHRPDDVVALSNLAVEFKFSGRYADSETVYRKALAASPRDPQVLNDLGLAYLGAGRAADARRTFLEGVDAAPGSLDNLENLGWLSRHEGRLDESVGWYRRALAAARERGGDVPRFTRTLDDLLFPLAAPPAGK
jgi:tetratricopeptide (TPR) repeat protein